MASSVRLSGLSKGGSPLGLPNEGSGRVKASQGQTLKDRIKKLLPCATRVNPTPFSWKKKFVRWYSETTDVESFKKNIVLTRTFYRMVTRDSNGPQKVLAFAVACFILVISLLQLIGRGGIWLVLGLPYLIVAPKSRLSERQRLAHEIMMEIAECPPIKQLCEEACVANGGSIQLIIAQRLPEDFATAVTTPDGRIVIAHELFFSEGIRLRKKHRLVIDFIFELTNASKKHLYRAMDDDFSITTDEEFARAVNRMEWEGEQRIRKILAECMKNYGWDPKLYTLRPLAPTFEEEEMDRDVTAAYMSDFRYRVIPYREKLRRHETVNTR